jgi:hypothetical protein
MKIKYVGAKTDGETAFIHLTGLTWLPGDSFEVDNKIAPRLLAHPDVFEQDTGQVAAVVVSPVVIAPVAGAIDPTTLTLTPGATVESIKPAAITLADGTSKVIGGLTKEELHELAKELGVKVHPASGAPKVTEALLAAFPVKG